MSAKPHPARPAWFRRMVEKLGRQFAALDPDRRPETLEDLERIEAEDGPTDQRTNGPIGEQS